MTAVEAKPRGRLRRSDCADPGIARRRCGRGFIYTGPDGERIEDDPTLERIASLAIPPAWKDVWICLDPLGHVQATGIDAAGRTSSTSTTSAGSAGQRSASSPRCGTSPPRCRACGGP